ncbi:MAG: hypothetical protein IT376_07470 [Polyangiaceae bacterium]|nr:hypothetical protein [Polyangiaceae bacterium]
MILPRLLVAAAWAGVVGMTACGTTPPTGAGAGDDAGATDATGAGGSGGAAGSAGAAGAGAPHDASDADGAEGASDGGGGGAASDAEAGTEDDTLSSNRQRLLWTYLRYLTSTGAPPQSNGVSGSNVASAYEVWERLDASTRATFLTLTARMQGSVVGSTGRSMLSHVVRLYRVVGGEGATASEPGSCGGGEFNRMIVSMEPALHAALLAAAAHQGAAQPGGAFDLADVLPGTAWRDSHDLGGPHAPFDATDETAEGAPRGQTQYFRDPASAVALAPLGRLDLESLVDPYALEIDHDYDCIHASNPLCTYVYYGPLCSPQPSALGVEMYESKYPGNEPFAVP